MAHIKILILNVGSSSVKYSLFKDEAPVMSGLMEKVKDYKTAINSILLKVGKVDAIGHRVVHGGDIKKTVLIDRKTISKIKRYTEFAPLHNAPELRGIEISRQFFPNIKQYAIFDTAFHSTIPEKASIYGIPYGFYKKGIKRCGFHGTSHKYVTGQAAKILKKPLNKLKLITCHLGNGCSITAVDKGKSVDTSMGITPLEGLVMGTRCGDIDAGILLYLMGKYSKGQLDKILNEKSGLLGISGISNDVRDLLKSKNKRAKLALDVFCYRIVKYIGAYNTVLKGTDAIIFTAGIGEHAHVLRKKILDELKFLGIKLDESKNTKKLQSNFLCPRNAKHFCDRKNNLIITKTNSKIKVLVIPTNEESIMVREILEII